MGILLGLVNPLPPDALQYGLGPLLLLIGKFPLPLPRPNGGVLLLVGLVTGVMLLFWLGGVWIVLGVSLGFGEGSGLFWCTRLSTMTTPQHTHLRTVHYKHRSIILIHHSIRLRQVFSEVRLQSRCLKNQKKMTRLFL